jgi:hypothetical protein
VVSLVLYAIFIFVQTARHRDFFLPEGVESEDTHAAPPTVSVSWLSLALLLLSLVAVVGLAKVMAPGIEGLVKAARLPQGVVGIAIALMVLMPETWAAVRAALRNRMQISFNLALGSALATIGLTIPAVAVTSIALRLPLTLGLPPKEVALLALSLLLSSMTLNGGRATVLQGAVHLVVFAVFPPPPPWRLCRVYSGERRAGDSGKHQITLKVQRQTVRVVKAICLNHPSAARCSRCSLAEDWQRLFSCATNVALSQDYFHSSH